jgi:hypothetical protein
MPLTAASGFDPACVQAIGNAFVSGDLPLGNNLGNDLPDFVLPCLVELAV